MRLLSYTNREIIEEARELLGDPLASEQRCKEFVRQFIARALVSRFAKDWKPGDVLTDTETEYIGWLWNEQRTKYDE